MKRILWMAVWPCVLMGCQQPAKRYHAQLDDAHAALSDGQIGRAERALGAADDIAVQHGLERPVIRDLLGAEIRLQEGDAYSALLAGQEAAQRCPPNSLDRARAEELIGKSALRQGQFEAAREHLSFADRLYESAADRERVSDLTRLAEGLVAYGRGRLAEAHDAWGQITDPRMRESLDRELQAAGLASSGH